MEAISHLVSILIVTSGMMASVSHSRLLQTLCLNLRQWHCSVPDSQNFTTVSVASNRKRERWRNRNQDPPTAKAADSSCLRLFCFSWKLPPSKARREYG